MYTITPREIAGLTPAERMQGNVERFIGEQSQLVALMAERNRNRAIRAAIDEIENNGDEQMPPDEEEAGQCW